MLLIFGNRYELIELLSSGPIATMVELGVYEGKLSDYCQQVLRPERYVLVDQWDYTRYCFVLEDAPQSQRIRQVFDAYFGAHPQQALHAAYEKVLARFQDDPAVEILRVDIAEAANQFTDASIDVIYLDGNHTYEYVLRDLYVWFPKLRPGGLFICNDFFESQVAAQQNVGVIPAFQTFAKRRRTYPIAVSASDWSDLYFSNQPSSELINRFINGVFSRSYHAVDIPIELLGSYSHRIISLPEGGQCLLPSFTARTVEPEALLIPTAELQHGTPITSSAPPRSSPDLGIQGKAMSLQKRIAKLEQEYGKLDRTYQHCAAEYVRLEEAYRVLESHYLAAEAERKHLEKYIRSREDGHESTDAS